MISDKNISEDMLNSFKKRWSELDWENKRHFSYRAARISKDDFWDKKMKSFLPMTMKEYVKLNSRNNKERISLEDSLSIFSADIPSNFLKVKIQNKYPGLIYLDRLFTHYRYLYLFDLVNKVEQIKKVDLVEAIALDSEVLKNWPVWSIERIFDLFWFFGVDMTLKLKNTFIELYSVKSDDERFRVNYWYGLTHVVLGRSSFYRKRVDDNWAGKLLVEGFDEIISDFSIDLASETGVCLRLCGYEDRVDFKKLEARISDEFDEEEKLILRDGFSDLNKLEHRNILSLMALGSFRKII